MLESRSIAQWTVIAMLGATGIGCGEIPIDDGSEAAQQQELAHARPLRRLTGDATTIDTSWSASEAGIRYDVVTDGEPGKPWISPAHAFGHASIAFHVPTTPAIKPDEHHKERIEYKIAKASDPDGLHFDNARYSGFAVKLEDSPKEFLGSAIFWQAWQGFPWGPPVSLKFTTDDSAPYRIKLAIRDMRVGPESKSTSPDIEIWSDSMIEPGRWYSFLVYLEPRYDRNGHIKLWIDGVKHVDWTGAFGYNPDRPDQADPQSRAYDGLDLKNGIYQPDPNNEHTLYFDQIVLTNTYGEAAAALGW